MYSQKLHNQATDVVFHLEGVLTLEDTAGLRQAFWEAINQHPVKRLIVNFEQVPKIDSAVISLLVATKNVVARIQASLILVGLRDSHKQFLERTHLHRYFEVQPDLETCLASAS